MACNCIDQVKEKLHAHLMQDVPEGSEIAGRWDGTGWDNEVYSLGPKMGVHVMLNYKLAYRAPKKDGSMAKNLTRKEVKMKMTYCPLCGVKYEEEQE